MEPARFIIPRPSPASSSFQTVYDNFKSKVGDGPHYDKSTAASSETTRPLKRLTLPTQQQMHTQNTPPLSSSIQQTNDQQKTFVLPPTVQIASIILDGQTPPPTPTQTTTTTGRISFGKYIKENRGAIWHLEVHDTIGTPANAFRGKLIDAFKPTYFAIDVLCNVYLAKTHRPLFTRKQFNEMMEINSARTVNSDDPNDPNSVENVEKKI